MFHSKNFIAKLDRNMYVSQLVQSNCYLSCIIFLALIITPVRSLRCYICHTNDNKQCQLQNCPDDQAYDRCMTTLYRNPPDGRNIKKECALAPCHLRGLRHLNFANFKSNCESSKQDDCIFCCTQDECNKDAAKSQRISINEILICLIISLFYITHNLTI